MIATCALLISELEYKLNMKIKGIEIVFANSLPLSKMLFAWFDMNSIISHIIILMYEICH